MRLWNAILGLLVLAFLLPAYVLPVRADIQFPKPNKIDTDEKTLEEFGVFYDEIEAALKEEDIDKIMSFYHDEYLHHGITKKQLRFM